MSNSPVTVPSWTEPDPEEAVISGLVVALSAADGPADAAGVWPEVLWSLLVKAGAPRWSLPSDLGGTPVPRPLLVQRYARMAEGSLTAVFILSQHDAAVRRLAAAVDRPAARYWLSEIAAGRAFATVGISQLTTSRRLGSQALMATAQDDGSYRLRGAMPWVTAAVRADVFVTGALLDDGRQLLIALPSSRPGLAVRPSFELAALQASCTAEVVLEDVTITPDDLLAGPTHELSSQPGAVGTAGLETSALAMGQARAAITAIVGLAAERLDLEDPADVLVETWQQDWAALMACARGDPEAVSAGQIRAQANALVLRSTQAFLTARKGSGFLRSEPAQRWARQALFFLVWSCPTRSPRPRSATSPGFARGDAGSSGLYRACAFRSRPTASLYQNSASRESSTVASPAR